VAGQLPSGTELLADIELLAGIELGGATLATALALHAAIADS